jgi:transposase
VRDFYKYHGTCSQIFRKYYNRYQASGMSNDLFPRRRGPRRRVRSQVEVIQAKEAMFKVLHSPPSEFGFNRATWKRADLQQALRTTGITLSKRDIQSIIKAAGYRWLKAKQVPTSRDPEYRTKLDDEVDDGGVGDALYIRERCHSAPLLGRRNVTTSDFSHRI